VLELEASFSRFVNVSSGLESEESLRAFLLKRGLGFFKLNIFFIWWLGFVKSGLIVLFIIGLL